MKRRTIIILVGVLLSIVLGLYLYFYFKNKKAIYYWRTVSIENGDVNVLVTATGTMAADTSVDVGVQVSGIIANIKTDFNAVVKKGQIIAVLDTTLYYTSKLDAYAALNRAGVAAGEAKREYHRSKSLYENKIIAQVDYEKALAAFQNAQSNYVSAQALVNRAIINLRYCTITAPINGTVIARNVQAGNMVIASFSSPVLFTIAYDLTKMQVQANVDEADIGLVKVGQEAKFTVGAYPNDVFNGVVTQIRHQPLVVSNVVNYVVIIEVENPDLKLIPGLTANSNIFIEQRKNVLKVPSNAFSFVPPAEYIQAAKQLPDSTKTFWLKKQRATTELKKQEIVESIESEGFIWIKKAQDIFPIKVTKDLNDGSFTAVSGDIQEGDEVVTGINQNAPVDTKTSSPFMPKFPSRKKQK